MTGDMELPWVESYWLARFLFQRGLALLYLLAFLVAATQFRPLAGEDGLLPLAAYRDRWSFRDRPSLFYLIPDDRVIAAAAWMGVVVSTVLFVAGPYYLPAPYAVPASMALWAVLWVLYLSFVNAGQTFYGYGWESMLLETGFLAIFLGAGGSHPPTVIIWLLKWVLFRNMFGAGLIKLRGDDCWRELTCLDFHYETQPIPNPLSWYAHHLPDRFHRVETFGNHVVELAVPFLYFAPQPVAAAAGVVTIVFQAWLMLTGNFSWLNALTAVLAVSTFSDSVLAGFLPVSTTGVEAAPLYLQVLAGVVALLVVMRSVRPTRNMLSDRQVMNTSYDPFHLVNSYGAFGSVTRTRYELVIEATTDHELTDDTTWHPYTFPGKPTDPARRPPQIAPYHLRLDWQLWFAAMSRTPHRHPWFIRLLERLLQADDRVLSLVATDPFDGTPPTYIRARRYRYRYTTPGERAETGQWWIREDVGAYVPPLSHADITDTQQSRSLHSS